MPVDNWDKKTEIEIAHQRREASKVGEIAPTPDSTIERFRRNKLWWVWPKEYVFRSLGDVTGRHILDFGCGTGEIAVELARLGAYVSGMDISPELIDIAKRRADLNGVEKRTNFIAGDITKLPLPQNRFDSIVCYAVLHHVDLRTVVPLLWASLKPGGMMVIYEPIAFSPALQAIREKMPVEKSGGPVDRQLNRDEFKHLMELLAGSHATFYDLFSRLGRIIPSTGRIGRLALITLGALDRLLLILFPFLSRFSGSSVIVGQKPLNMALPIKRGVQQTPTHIS